MSNVSWAEFAQSLVTLATPALTKGYSDMVSALRANAGLAKIAKEQGLTSAIASSELASLKKSNQEFATAGEKEAERLMRDAVEKTFPTHAIVGEELGTKKGSALCWVFDPVDGTSAMVRTAIADAFHLALPLAAFGVTIAVVENEKAVLGAVAELKAKNGQLTMGDVWVGEQDKTTVNGKALSIPKTPAIKDAVVASTVPQVMFNTMQKWGGYQALAEATKTQLADLNCIGFMHLVSGGVDIAYESGLAYHDAAALVPILQGAGVTVTDANGQALDFSQGNSGKEFTVLAARPALHSEALACIKKGVAPGKNSFSEKKNAALGYVSKFPSA